MKRTSVHGDDLSQTASVDPDSSSKGQSISSRDELKLAHFGKKQQFRRNFSLLSIVGLSCTLMITWEGALALLQPLLINGGPTGAFGAYFFVIFGVLMQILVMAELGSMIPLSGGAYNWVAVLSPPRWASVLSYFTGWVSVVAYQASSLSEFYINSTIIQALVALNYPDYVPQPWHALLIFYALILIGLMVTTVGGKIFPHFESLTLILHIITFFCILITLVYLAPKNDPSVVFETFINGGGFTSDAQSWFVGSVTVMYTFLGADAASHMAEEIKNAQAVIPRAMILAVLINGLLGIGTFVVTVFCMGPIDSILESQFSFPFLQILANATQSIPAATAVTALILTVTIFGSIGFVATSSRMIWAFAREGGLPGSRLLSKVDGRISAPVPAILTTCVVNMLLGLISLGSSTAFNAFSNLTVCTFYTVFMIVGSIMLWKRLTTAASDFMWGPFRLGKLGVPITILALIYSFLGWLFSFFPPTAALTAQTFNWSFVVYWSFMLVALGWWLISARHHYTGPRIEINIYAEK